MRAARGVLIGLGAVGTVVGGWLALTNNRPAGIVGLIIWLAVAVVLHDAILSPVLFVAARVMRSPVARLPLAAVAVVQVAAVVGGIGSLLLLPAIRAKQIGVRNPTVLPLDYAAHLAGMWIVLAVLAAAGVALVLVRRARSRSDAGAEAEAVSR